MSLKVALIISSMSHGGAERQVALLSRSFADDGASVTIFTFAGNGIPAFYAPGENVEIRRMNLLSESTNFFSSIYSNIRRLRVLRENLSEFSPDVVFAFGDSINIITVLALVGTGIPVAVSERIDPTKHDIGAMWSFLRTVVYPMAWGVVVQTQGIKEVFPAEWNVRVVPNGFSVPLRSAAPAGMKGEGKVMLAAGRLVPQKGFMDLIRAFAGVVEEFSDWRLVIRGEGEQRSQLEEFIRGNGLEPQVFLPGVAEGMGDEYSSAHLFVLSSLFEGFPNVLGEALAHGLPCIAFSDVSGVAELLQGDVNGLLVHPADDRIIALSGALRRLMADDVIRERMGQASLERIQEYSMEKAFNCWKGLAMEMVTARKE